MSIWSANQTLNVPDESLQRQGFGTVGGDHVVNGSMSNRKSASVVDSLDTRITYGAFNAGTAGFAQLADLSFTSRGSQVVIGGVATNGAPNSAAAYRFTGTSIGVLASTNPQSGIIQIYIDGVLTQGKLPVNAGLTIQSGINAPAVYAADTVISVYGTTASFPTSGRLLVGQELIDYTGTTGTTFTGCIRGVGGTIAADHTAADAISLWDSQVDLATVTEYATRRLVYYNPLLQPGDHQIIIVAQTSPSSTYSRVYFEGFIQGQLLGAGNIFTQIGTITKQLTTSANGYADIGTFTQFNPDIVIISILGFTQPNAAGDNTVPLGTMGFDYNAGTLPHLYLHNGQASSTFNITITFCYIGESL
jgi:hypothetical protein